MKKITLAIFILFNLNISTQAQKLMKIVYVKVGTITTNPKEAEWLIAIRKVDGLYQRNDYKMNGPLKKVKTFKDLNQTILEGNYLEYDDNGKLTLAGYYTNNKKSGRWFYYDDSGKVYKTEKFEGKTVLNDSSKYFKTQLQDTLIKPSFKKGGNEWKYYIRETIDWESIYPSLNHEEVKVSFTITKSGDISNIVLLASSSFNFDNEVIKMLDRAPKWHPASFGGEAIDFTERQSITALNF